MVAESVTSVVTILIRDVLTVVAAFAVMIIQSPKLTIFVAILFPIVASLVRILGLAFRRYSGRIQDTVGEVSQVDQGFLGTFSLATSPAPQILPPLGGGDAYALCDKLTGTTTIYPDFAPFADALAGRRPTAEPQTSSRCWATEVAASRASRSRGRSRSRSAKSTSGTSAGS